MAASLMSRKERRIAAVIVGADRVAANGDTANKIGTYSLAVLARFHGIKFLVAAPRTTIDLATKTGEEIVIEERSEAEVRRIKGPPIGLDDKVDLKKDAVTVNIAAEGINIWNPAFDVTPAHLIDGIITEKDVVTKVPGSRQFSLEHLFPPLESNGHI